MAFWGKLFGSDEALKSVVDNVSSALDVLVYTNEEKATDGAKERSEARQMVVGWMAATQGQNLARRLIALSITGVWLLGIVAEKMVSGFAVFAEDAAQLQKLAKVMAEGSRDMSNPVMLILAFYFAAPHMGGIAKAVTAKFTKDANK